MTEDRDSRVDQLYTGNAALAPAQSQLLTNTATPITMIGKQNACVDQVYRCDAAALQRNGSCLQVLQEWYQHNCDSFTVQSGHTVAYTNV